MDGTVWNGTDPEGYASRFAIHRKGLIMPHLQNTKPQETPESGK